MLVVWIGAAVWLERHGRLPAPDGTFDAIVVPGCKVWEGGQASGALDRRVRLAVRLFHEGRAPLFVTTGGLGEHPPTEARCAALLAVSLGVPEHVIVEEGQSTSTEENARFAASLVNAPRVLVVSDAYHAWRCQRVFARHFDEVRAVGAPVRGRGAWRQALREAVVCAVYAVRSRL